MQSEIKTPISKMKLLTTISLTYKKATSIEIQVDKMENLSDSKFISVEIRLF